MTDHAGTKLMRYIGEKEHLKDKTAIVCISNGFAHAQFDDLSLDEAYGWHMFNENEFEAC